MANRPSSRDDELTITSKDAKGLIAAIKKLSIDVGRNTVEVGKMTARGAGKIARSAVAPGIEASREAIRMFKPDISQTVGAALSAINPLIGGIADKMIEASKDQIKDSLHEISGVLKRGIGNTYYGMKKLVGLKGRPVNPEDSLYSDMGVGGEFTSANYRNRIKKAPRMAGGGTVKRGGIAVVHTGEKIVSNRTLDIQTSLLSRIAIATENISKATSRTSLDLTGGPSTNITKSIKELIDSIDEDKDEVRSLRAAEFATMRKRKSFAESSLPRKMFRAFVSQPKEAVVDTINARMEKHLENIDKHLGGNEKLGLVERMDLGMKKMLLQHPFFEGVYNFTKWAGKKLLWLGKLDFAFKMFTPRMILKGVGEWFGRGPLKPGSLMSMSWSTLFKGKYSDDIKKSKDPYVSMNSALGLIYRWTRLGQDQTFDQLNTIIELLGGAQQQRETGEGEMWKWIGNMKNIMLSQSKMFGWTWKSQQLKKEMAELQANKGSEQWNIYRARTAGAAGLGGGTSGGWTDDEKDEILTHLDIYEDYFNRMGKTLKQIQMCVCGMFSTVSHFAGGMGGGGGAGPKKVYSRTIPTTGIPGPIQPTGLPAPTKSLALPWGMSTKVKETVQEQIKKIVEEQKKENKIDEEIKRWSRNIPLTLDNISSGLIPAEELKKRLEEKFKGVKEQSHLGSGGYVPQKSVAEMTLEEMKKHFKGTKVEQGLGSGGFTPKKSLEDMTLKEMMIHFKGKKAGGFGAGGYDVNAVENMSEKELRKYFKGGKKYASGAGGYNVKKFGDGGVTPGKPTPAIVGEKGPELITPLNKLKGPFSILSDIYGVLTEIRDGVGQTTSATQYSTQILDQQLEEEQHQNLEDKKLELMRQRSEKRKADLDARLNAAREKMGSKVTGGPGSILGGMFSTKGNDLISTAMRNIGVLPMILKSIGPLVAAAYLGKQAWDAYKIMSDPEEQKKAAEDFQNSVAGGGKINAAIQGALHPAAAAAALLLTIKQTEQAQDQVAEAGRPSGSLKKQIEGARKKYPDIFPQFFELNLKRYANHPGPPTINEIATAYIEAAKMVRKVELENKNGLVEAGLAATKTTGQLKEAALEDPTLINKIAKEALKTDYTKMSEGDIATKSDTITTLLDKANKQQTALEQKAKENPKDEEIAKQLRQIKATTGNLKAAQQRLIDINSKKFKDRMSAQTDPAKIARDKRSEQLDIIIKQVKDDPVYGKLYNAMYGDQAPASVDSYTSHMKTMKATMNVYKESIPEYKFWYDKLKDKYSGFDTDPQQITDLHNDIVKSLSAKGGIDKFRAANPAVAKSIDEMVAKANQIKEDAMKAGGEKTTELGKNVEDLAKKGKAKYSEYQKKFEDFLKTPTGQKIEGVYKSGKGKIEEYLQSDTAKSIKTKAADYGGKAKQYFEDFKTKFKDQADKLKPEIENLKTKILKYVDDLLADIEKSETYEQLIPVKAQVDNITDNFMKELSIIAYGAPELYQQILDKINNVYKRIKARVIDIRKDPELLAKVDAKVAQIDRAQAKAAAAASGPGGNQEKSAQKAEWASRLAAQGKNPAEIRNLIAGGSAESLNNAPNYYPGITKNLNDSGSLEAQAAKKQYMGISKEIGNANTGTDNKQNTIVAPTTNSIKNNTNVTNNNMSPPDPGKALWADSSDMYLKI